VRLKYLFKGGTTVTPFSHPSFGGIGKLGLAGMHERARLLGGSLKVQSELGKGTQVVVEIPS